MQVSFLQAESRPRRVERRSRGKWRVSSTHILTVFLRVENIIFNNHSFHSFALYRHWQKRMSLQFCSSILGNACPIDTHSKAWLITNSCRSRTKLRIYSFLLLWWTRKKLLTVTFLHHSRYLHSENQEALHWQSCSEKPRLHQHWTARCAEDHGGQYWRSATTGRSSLRSLKAVWVLWISGSYSIGKDSLFGSTFYAVRFYLVLLRIHLSKMDYIASFQYICFFLVWLVSIELEQCSLIPYQKQLLFRYLQN